MMLAHVCYLWLLAVGRHSTMITSKTIENRKCQKASSSHSSDQSCEKKKKEKKRKERKDISQWLVCHLSDHEDKGTGRNKFVQRGPTLSGVVGGGGGYQRHHLSHEHYQQNFIGFKGNIQLVRVSIAR